MSLSAQCRVYAAFDGSGPFETSPTWTEITAYTQRVSVTRGRSNELEDFQAGRAQIVLKNTDSRFDQYGGVYTNVSIRIPVKIEGVYGSTYPLFHGVVDSIDYSYPNKTATATFECVDLLGVLAQTSLVDTAHEMVVKSLSPVAWWRLGDESTTMKDSVGTRDGSYTGDRERVDGLTLPSESAGASRLNAPAGSIASSIATGTFTATPSTTACTVSAVVQFNPASGPSAGIVRLSDGGSGGFTLSAANGVFTVSVTQASPLINTQLKGGSVAGTHHVAVTRSGANLVLYVDGVSVATSSAHGTAAVAWVGCSVGDTVGTADITVDELAIWDTALSSGAVSDLAASAFGWPQDSTSARIQRVLDQIGVSSYTLDSGSYNVGVFRGGTNAADYLQSVARSENGRLFVNRSGAVEYHAIQHDMSASASVSFDVREASTGSVRFATFGSSLNSNLLYNRITVTGVDCAHTHEETSSQGVFGVRSLSWSTELPTVEMCEAVATYLGYSSSPALRLKAWAAYPERRLNGSTTLGYASVIPIELGAVISITPASLVSYNLSVTGIAHRVDLSAGTWEVTMSGVNAQIGQAFEWGVSEWGDTSGWG